MTRDAVVDLVRGELEPRDKVERVCFDFARAASAIQLMSPMKS
jgi:hypothetical protein